VFQQESAPAHRAHDTLAFLARETPQFIGPELQLLGYQAGEGVAGVWLRSPIGENSHCVRITNR